jgi:hypothetical protein
MVVVPGAHWVVNAVYINIQIVSTAVPYSYGWPWLVKVRVIDRRDLQLSE